MSATSSALLTDCSISAVTIRLCNFTDGCAVIITTLTQRPLSAMSMPTVICGTVSRKIDQLSGNPGILFWLTESKLRGKNVG